MKREHLLGQTLAIAGTLQAAQMVEETAHGSEPAEDMFRASVHSLFAFHPQNAAEVYGGLKGAQHGLECMIKMRQLGWTRDQGILRYTYDLMRVERKLEQYPEIQPVLRKRLEEIHNREDFKERSLDSLCDDINIVYLDTLSKMDYRIHLQGRKKALSDPKTQAKIRALLMAGVRSVMLWRQQGGNIVRLFLRQRKIFDTAEHLLQQMRAS